MEEFSEEGVLMRCGFIIETNNWVLYMGFTNGIKTVYDDYVYTYDEIL